MADIKNSVLFQKKQKNPLDKIKKYNAEQKSQTANNNKSTKPKSTKPNNKKTKKVDRKSKIVVQNTEKKKSSVGAPDKFLDKALKATSSVRLSAASNSILRELTEKYATDKTKDEIIIEALNEYVVTHLEKDDRILLLNDLKKDLAIFREKHPTISIMDEYGNVIQTKEEIENKTIEIFREGFKLK